MKYALLGMTALAVFAVAAPANAVVLHNYDLNGSLADSLGGPSLTANGGVLGPTGYSFGANQGLALSGLGIAADGAYTIELGFSFATLSSYRKIIDFSGLVSDSGLYVLNSALNFYPVTTGPGGAFTVDQIANLVLNRTSGGLVTGSVNGVEQISFLDSGALALSNTLNFFIDDFATGQREASAGFVDYIRISGTAPVSAVPLPPALPLLAAALGGFGLLSRRRKAKAA
jgi:hypothetical protein